jgi:hypothetical protein
VHRSLPQVRVLGVDDWAGCKGQTFGTILVDLERSQVVDLATLQINQYLQIHDDADPAESVGKSPKQSAIAEACVRGCLDRVKKRLNLTFDERRCFPSVLEKISRS